MVKNNNKDNNSSNTDGRWPQTKIYCVKYYASLCKVHQTSQLGCHAIKRSLVRFQLLSIGPEQLGKKADKISVDDKVNYEFDF